MDFDSITFASQGESSLLIFRCPEEISQNGVEVECFAQPIFPRTNGLLLCIPRNVISEEAMIAALTADEEGFLGPTKLIQAPLCEESEDGATVTTSGPHRHMYLVDFNQDVLHHLQEYDPITMAEAAIIPYDQEVPNAIPVSSTVVEIANVWVTEQGFARANFYSAREEQEAPVEPEPKAPAKATSKKANPPKRISNAQVMEQLAQMASQIQALAARQETAEQGRAGGAGQVLQAERAFGSTQPVPAVSAGLASKGAPHLGAVAKALDLAGPPPRTRQSKAVPGAPDPAEEEVSDPFRQPAIIAPNTGIEAALAQQSTAITTLVAHLANQADPLGELSSTAVSSSSTKGVQRRERLQNDLASRNSTYYMQVMQQVHRRLHPGRPAPKTESDLAGLSFLSYLEKNGGFRHHRDAGLMMWLLGHIMEAAATDDTWLMKERLALAIVALDQSVADQGDWTLGYLLSLAEDPPIALFQEKSSVTSPFGKPFSALVPPTWAAICLAYVKELETLTSRKAETSPKKNKDNKGDDHGGPPSPKRKARFPKKPKAEPPAQ